MQAFVEIVFDDKYRQFLIPCGGDGVLKVIAEQLGRSWKVIETTLTARGARTGAIDQATGKTYLPTADFEPGNAGERLVAKPGTFRILVLDRD
jgi:hypothetical protein